MYRRILRRQRRDIVQPVALLARQSRVDHRAHLGRGHLTQQNRPRVEQREPVTKRPIQLLLRRVLKGQEQHRMLAVAGAAQQPFVKPPRRDRDRVKAQDQFGIHGADFIAQRPADPLGLLHEHAPVVLQPPLLYQPIKTFRRFEDAGSGGRVVLLPTIQLLKIEAKREVTKVEPVGKIPVIQLVHLQIDDQPGDRGMSRAKFRLGSERGKDLLLPEASIQRRHAADRLPLRANGRRIARQVGVCARIVRTHEPFHATLTQQLLHPFPLFQQLPLLDVPISGCQQLRIRAPPKQIELRLDEHVPHRPLNRRLTINIDPAGPHPLGDDPPVAIRQRRQPLRTRTGGAGR